MDCVEDTFYEVEGGRVRHEGRSFQNTVPYLRSSYPHSLLLFPPVPVPESVRVPVSDAAHALTPALGQGANLAFEDGMELAQQLANHPSLKYTPSKPSYLFICYYIDVNKELPYAVRPCFGFVMLSLSR